MNILLVQPEYSQAKRTKHEAKLCPVGLFKHYFYHKHKGDIAIIITGNKQIDFKPDIIKITSLYTYWSDDVFRSIEFYSSLYPDSKIAVGGIFASLMPNEIKARYPFVEVFEGLDEEIEKTRVDWNKLNSSIQIIHASRSCVRHCDFCGVRKIEKKITFKKWEEIKKEVQKNEIVFFDNNFLMSPHHKEVLDGLAVHKINGKVIKCEFQSGFDPRLLTKEDAILLKKARAKSIRISWDHGLEQLPIIREALKHLQNAGFNSKNTGIFMIYNWDYPFEILETKRKVCFEWNVQIFDCRYRPLDQLYDNYNSRAKAQAEKDYYIHPSWTDAQVRQFRKNIRRQNIMIRFNFKTEKQMDEWINSKKKTATLINRKLCLEKQLALI